MPTIAALICSAFHFGCACRVSAATPATCGADIEVPDSVSGPLPVPTPADTVETPGAVISGFSALSPLRGPADENDAMPRKLGFCSSAFVTVTLPPSAARSRAPSELLPVGRPRTPKNGIVTV